MVQDTVGLMQWYRILYGNSAVVQDAIGWCCCTGCCRDGAVVQDAVEMVLWFKIL